jgi:hypothetical protein
MQAALLESQARRAPALAMLREIPRVVPCEPPSWAKKGAPRGTVSRGYTYERKVGKVLAAQARESGWTLWDHQWFEYQCDKKIKYFQPDFVIERPNETGIVVEVKLTYVDTTAQLQQYVEYLNVFGLNCFPITVVRHLTPAVQNVISDFNHIQPNSVLHLWI